MQEGGGARVAEKGMGLELQKGVGLELQKGVGLVCLINAQAIIMYK